MIELAQQVRGDLSGGAWWSSGESRLATPEGPAGCPLCTLGNRELLALATCRLEKDTRRWAYGALRIPLSTVGAGLQDQDGDEGDEDWPRRQPRRRVGGQSSGHLGVYLSIAEERRKMIGLSTCRVMGG